MGKRVVTARKKEVTQEELARIEARKPQSQKERDSIALAKLESWIDQIIDGHVTCSVCRKEFEAKELQPSAVALLKARYDKLRPSLSAVEQTTIQAESGTESDILAQIKRLTESNQEVREALLAILMNTPAQSAPVADIPTTAVQHGDNQASTQNLAS